MSKLDREEKLKRVANVIGQLDKTFGKGTFMKMSDKPREDIETVSSGSLGLDIALGVKGYPRGRIIEIYGPESSGKTTLTLHAIAQAQKAGGIAAFIDAEHAFDPIYAENLGVDMKELYFTQPDNGEQALEIAQKAIESGGFDIIVIDSVAALTPKSEIEGEMGDSKMGLHARLMSQALRKMTGAIGRTNTIVFFINQLRDKIGVMFGCFDYDTRVVLSDGSTRKIGQIVNGQQKGLMIKTFDKEGNCVSKPIQNVFKNSETRVEDFWKFTVAKGRDNGRSQFRVTGNHLISTPKGDIPADILKEGDMVLVQQTKTLSQQSFQILLGGLYGDSHLKVKSNGYFSVIQCQHGPKQIDYCKWKAELLGNSVRYDDKWNIWYTNPLIEFDQFNQRSEEWINRLDLLSIAIMYMDDGSLNKDRCFIYKRWSKNEIEILHQRIYELTGATGSINEKYGRITYCTKQMRLFIDSIASFIPDCMRYKVYKGCQVNYEHLSYQHQDPIEILYPMPILSISKSKKKSIKFDIEVKDTHHYLVDGVMVHNSPEVTTGGNALKFYASVRLDIRRSTAIKDLNGEILGNKTKVKVVKNKVAPPFKVAEFDIMYGQGISKVGEIIDCGVELGIIDKSGSWFSYNDTKLGQGRDAVKVVLQDNPELLEEIEQQIYDNI